MENFTKKSPVPKFDARTTHNNVIVFRNDPDCSVVEILSPKDNDTDNDTVRIIEAFCVHVEPRACSRVVKQLSSTLPLEDCLSHLKRVRRRPSHQITSTEAIPKATSPVTDQQKVNQNTHTSKIKNNEGGTSPLATGPKTSLALDRPKKRHKPNFVLEILIGTYSRLHSKNEPSVKDHPIVREFGPLHSVMVPKYEPRSEQEWKEHNASWPTLYHPLRFEEYKKQQLALSETELKRMKDLMDRCISTRSVLIVDPNNHNPKNPAMNESSNNENMNDGNTIDLGIVSISRIEQGLQDQLSQQQQGRSSSSLLGNNPLATPILLALQGVSRCEREVKITIDGLTAVDTPSTGANLNKQQENQSQQKRGQYICTGYDMYSFYEPNVFEAMACLHSRLRRLVYFVPDIQSTLCSTDNKSSKGGSCVSNMDNDTVAWGHGLSKHDIHHLSGTNHNYRAFEYRQSSYAS